MTLHFRRIPDHIIAQTPRTAQLRAYGEAVVLEIAEREYGMRDLKILREERGKPYFENNPVFFSLAHSGNMLTAVFSDAPIGVDIEPADRVVPQRIADRYLEGDADIRAWTRYEAKAKLIGCGVPIPKNKVENEISIVYESRELTGYIITTAHEACG